MPKVIDALDFMNKKKKLPTEAFFVDTNVIIDYKDPLAFSNLNDRYRKRHEDITSCIQFFRSIQHKMFTTLICAVEYYKILQRRFYMKMEDTDDFDNYKFKTLKETNPDFLNAWITQAGAFRLLFKKKIPVIDNAVAENELVSSFQTFSWDFPDYSIYSIMKLADKSFHTMFSNDKDFYFFPDDFYLLTTNNEIIDTARNDGKLFT
jgi:hypothetical protein